MSLFGGLKISASALRVERLRMNVIAENIANAESTHTPAGGPYRRRQVLVGPALPGAMAGRNTPVGGVAALGVVEDPSPPRTLLDPSHPDADAEGLVQMPNVDVPLEIVDMVAATRAYEANAVAFSAQRQTQERTLELLA